MNYKGLVLCICSIRRILVPFQCMASISFASESLMDPRIQVKLRRILVPFQCMTSISFASESLMDPRIQVKLDKYQKCGNIISQTSLLSSIRD